MLSASLGVAEFEDPDKDTNDGSITPNRSINLEVTSHDLHDSDPEASPTRSEDPDMGGWGTSKHNYYNADIIETEADALEEEAEARRLQQKQLQGMTEADFGFDEAHWLGAGRKGEEDGGELDDVIGGVVREVLPQLEMKDDMSPGERLKLLETRYPEFEPLSKEFLELQGLLEDLKLAADAETTFRKLNASHINGTLATGTLSGETPVAALKYSALSAYLAALCMYFALLTSTPPSDINKPTAMPPSELRSHPVMESLKQSRSLWNKVKGFLIPSPVKLDLSSPPNPQSKPNGQPTLTTNGATAPIRSAVPIEKPRKRKSRTQKSAEAAEASVSARRAERLKQTEASLESLSSLAKQSSQPLKAKPNISPPPEASPSDFGDPTTLPAHEAARKAAVKKSLKFYTSQIACKSQKRELARRDAGGDADLPYKERLRDRQERLNDMAEKRGKKEAEKGEELGGEIDDGDLTVARDLRGNDNKEDDYYDLISSKAAQRKAEKVAQSTAELENRLTRCEDGDDQEGGKRKVSYAIAKNKGLAPKRKKEVRNPRVKKRKKYEEKRKKLGSVRQVWRGGEGKGYEGEKTGIKGGLVRSVKL